MDSQISFCNQQQSLARNLLSVEDTLNSAGMHALA